MAVTVAAYIVLAPMPTVLDTSRDIEVASRPITRFMLGLDDPAMPALGLGEKTATSCAVDAPNQVWQVTSTLWPVG